MGLQCAVAGEERGLINSNLDFRMLHAASEILRLQNISHQDAGRAMAEAEVSASKTRVADLASKLYKVGLVPPHAFSFNEST